MDVRELVSARLRLQRLIDLLLTREQKFIFLSTNGFEVDSLDDEEEDHHEMTAVQLPGANRMDAFSAR